MKQRCEFEAEFHISAKDGGFIISSGIPVRHKIVFTIEEVFNAIARDFDIVPIGRKLKIDIEPKE